MVSPYDGVSYPDICVTIPDWMRMAITAEIAKCMALAYSQIQIDTQFLRLTTKNSEPAPHGAHNDAIHGDYSAFYYINDKPAGVKAGTSLLTHKETLLGWQPESYDELQAWRRDANFYNAWYIDEMVEWEPNRLAIYPAQRMHRAEPPGGWGTGPQDGRLVLITFFSC